MIKLQEHIRLMLGSDPRCAMWRNQSGQYEAFPIGKKEAQKLLNLLKAGNVGPAVDLLERALSGGSRWIRYGLGKGGSDLIGINSAGRFLAFEVKEGRDSLSVDQAMFVELVNRYGGYAAEVRSAEHAISMLDESFE